MCIRHTPTCAEATASSAPGALSALMSFTIEAPSAIAARITSGFTVSTETGTGRSRRPLSTGSSRRNSSSGVTATSAPGRLDSAPTSTISAPSSTRRRAWSTAAPASRKRPPSEKESGVTFTTPMTSGRSSRSRNRPQARKDSGLRAEDRDESGSGDVLPLLASKSSALLCRRRRRGRAGSALLRRRLRSLGRLGQTRRLAFHYVVELVGVECLPLEQRLRNRFNLVAVVEDEFLRQGVLVVDDLA